MIGLEFGNLFQIYKIKEKIYNLKVPKKTLTLFLCKSEIS